MKNKKPHILNDVEYKREEKEREAKKIAFVNYFAKNCILYGLQQLVVFREKKQQHPPLIFYSTLKNKVINNFNAFIFSLSPSCSHKLFPKYIIIRVVLKLFSLPIYRPTLLETKCHFLGQTLAMIGSNLTIFVFMEPFWL